MPLLRGRDFHTLQRICCRATHAGRCILDAVVASVAKSSGPSASAHVARRLPAVCPIRAALMHVVHKEAQTQRMREWSPSSTMDRAGTWYGCGHEQERFPMEALGTLLTWLFAGSAAGCLAHLALERFGASSAGDMGDDSIVGMVGAPLSVASSNTCAPRHLLCHRLQPDEPAPHLHRPQPLPARSCSCCSCLSSVL